MVIRAHGNAPAPQQDLVEMGFLFRVGKTPNVTVTVRKTWDERFKELV